MRTGLFDTEKWERTDEETGSGTKRKEEVGSGPRMGRLQETKVAEIA